MTTYPLASPVQFGLTSVTWGPFENTSRAKSPWILEDIVQVFDGHQWQGTIAIAPHNKPDARALTAWVTSLRGRRGSFLFADPATSTPEGSAATVPGTPQVDGAAQTGTTLNLKGLPLSATDYLIAGDCIQLGSGISSRLYMVLQNLSSDGSGLASAEIWPPLRGATIDSETVVVSDAKGVFALDQDDISWSIRAPWIYDSISLNIKEVVTRL